MKPAVIDDATYVFPASVKEFMPEVPSDYPDKHEWTRVASDCFFNGFNEVRKRITVKDGVDERMALRHIFTVLRSYEPKHEHKEEAVGYLFYLWFDWV